MCDRAHVLFHRRKIVFLPIGSGMSWRCPRTVCRIGCGLERLVYAWRLIGSLDFVWYEVHGLALLRKAVLSGRRSSVMRETRRICARRLITQTRVIFSIIRKSISFDMWRLGIFEWSRRECCFDCARVVSFYSCR